jgi:hypothetical protein
MTYLRFFDFVELLAEAPQDDHRTATCSLLLREMWGPMTELNRTIMQNMGMSRDRTVSESAMPESTKRSCEDKSHKDKKCRTNDAKGFPRVLLELWGPIGCPSEQVGPELHWVRVIQFVGTCVYDNVV